MNTDFKILGLTVEGWQLVRTNNPRPIDERVIKGYWSQVYEQTIDDVVWSMGQFFFHDQELFRAWGVKKEEHCSFHTIQAESGVVHEGCPQYTLTTTQDGYVLVLEGNKTHHIHLF